MKTNNDQSEATAVASAASWLSAIEKAHNGNARDLLELLLTPSQSDSQGNPIQSSYFRFPDDVQLRLRIVEVLVFGPLRKGWAADNLDDMFVKTGWGSPTKPRLSDFEVSAVSMDIDAGGDINSHAQAYGIEARTLRKRIAKLREKPKP